MAEKLTTLSGDEVRPDEMYVQMDMILLGSYSAFDKSSGMEFTSYALTDLEDGTPRRMEILGTLLEESKYGDAAYASGATLDEEAYKALCDQWSSIERGERVTVRGKLTKAYFTDRYHLGKEDAQQYEVYMSVMELEPIVEKAVNANEIVFERIDDPNRLWAVCEMNSESITEFGLVEPCYVELELEVSKVEESNGRLYVYFADIEPSAEVDGTERSIKLRGNVEQYSDDELTSFTRTLFGARVDEATYKELNKKCSKLKSGQTVVVKGCIKSGNLNLIKNFYESYLAILDIDKK